MPHPLVLQLRFTRSEFRRALADVTEADARHRVEPMNTISWIIGHLAWHEQRCWLTRAQGQVIVPQVNEWCGYGRPFCNPPLDAVWEAWHTITKAADPYLDTLTTEALRGFMLIDGKPHGESIGSMLHRITYHYWYHLGESQAIRQMLGHTHLPQFVGDIHREAPYITEES